MIRFVCLSLISFFIGLPALAHNMQPAIASIEFQEDRAVIDLRVNLEAILAGIDASQFENTDEAPAAQAARYTELRALDNQQWIQQALSETQWLSELTVTGAVGLEVLSVETESVEDLELPRFTQFSLAAAGATKGAQFGWSQRLGLLVIRHDDSGFSQLLEPGQMSDALGGPVASSDVVAKYVVSGIQHIIPLGLDHILFVMGLFFFGASWRVLLAQVSVFTVAHTITLALASLSIVTLSGAIVEPLIAASIVYVGIENCLKPSAFSVYRRLILIFGFGLLHGLGFASVLSDFGLTDGAFALSLISFNIGVELGQLLVLAPLVILLGTWAVHQPWYRMTIQIPASLLIAGVGAWWVLERTVLG